MKKLAFLSLTLLALTGCRALGFDHQTWPGGNLVHPPRVDRAFEVARRPQIL